MTQNQARKPGVLLINLGSPASPHVPDVRAYLKEFLSDGRVLTVPAPVRATVLNLFILPFRPKKSAEAYESIWTPEGSPLVVSTRKVAALLAEQTEHPVGIAMRYGDPSIEQGIADMRAKGVDDLLVIPLYPHYAMSSYETVVAKVQEVAAKDAPGMRLTFQPPFYDDPDYLDALADSIKPHLEAGYDQILFSYHGIPESHVKRGDSSGCYCLKYEDCCARKHPAQSFCYRAHIHATTWGVTKRLGIAKDKYTIAFQSRLGNEPWLKPYTDKELERFPTQGVKRLVVICPAFVSDCLETLEEINIRGREDFIQAGGKEFTYVPCLNEDPAWIKVLARFVDDAFAAEL
jgi:protoporphyrin/coproporphyrin ferrochelatase